MSEEYTLVRDIVYDHNERMLNIKKYYPFFKLTETSFSQYRDGRFEKLDMGYIMMAVLRFFIEENNFREKMVTYKEYADFCGELLRRDFELEMNKEEEKELVSFIFDKLKNEGKPFTYEYFNPVTKKKAVLRTRIIDNKIVEDNVVYYITSDAIEFYLDTKEVKDESNITVAQVLLSKMISNHNFKGGTEVVARINNEVSRLISKKDEILGILSFNVFEGTKAYEEFIDTTVKWFDDEQKLFEKNKQLIEKALRTAEGNQEFYQAMEDIYKLETELNRAMNKHSELLLACTNLQSTVDEMVHKAKIGRIKARFDFRRIMSEMIARDDSSNLSSLIKPLLKLNNKKTFSLTVIDNMLNLKAEEKENGEKIKKLSYDSDFKYEDELQDERIDSNFCKMLDTLFELLVEKESFDVNEFNEELKGRFSENVFNNSDYYSFMVHICQKRHYDMMEIREKPDTFLEGFMKNVKEEKYKYLTFDVEPLEEEEIINIHGNEILNVRFVTEKR